MTDLELQQQRRDKWRLNGKPIRTIEEARAFVEEVGFCLMYPQRPAFLAPTFVGAFVGADEHLPEWRHAFKDPRAAQATELGRLLRQVEDIMGVPVEIEWARDEAGFKLLQARPLHVEPARVPDEIWLRHPGLNGHPAGVGWGSGRACVVNCECELTRVAPGDILVTRVAGPALSAVLPRVAGLVAELGGSTSHLASLARERGIPMVLGVLDATLRIPDGVQVAVDGVAGVVRWMPAI